MAITWDEGETRCVLRLEGEVEVADAAELKRALVEAIASRKELQVEMASAAGLDVTAVQLLWAARRAAEKAGTSCTYGRVPEPALAALRGAGFEDFPGSTEVGVPPVIPGADCEPR